MSKNNGAEVIEEVGMAIGTLLSKVDELQGKVDELKKEIANIGPQDCEEHIKPTTAGDLKAGNRFVYGGIEWVKLDNAYGGALVLAVNKQADASFDENESNNWATSSLRKSLNATKNGRFAEEFLKGIVKADLIEFERDITTDDGMTEYGTCKDFISLYTCNEYRKYRKLIPDCGAWHWTITGNSLIYSLVVRTVGSGGCIGNGVYLGRCGVRPLIVLKQDVIVEVKR